MMDKDPEYTMTHKEFHTDYVAYCTLNWLNPIMIPELLRLVGKFHPEAVSQEPPQIIGLRPKQEPKEEPGEPEEKAPLLTCRMKSCGKTFDTLAEFTTHLLNHSFKGTTCTWAKCKFVAKDEAHLKHHIKVHIPLSLDDEKESPKSPVRPSQQDSYDDLKGIPLCALLVIRNIAKHPQNHQYFAPFEKDLATMLTNQKFNRTVAAVLAELK
jgi:hypothetical protein